MSSKLWTEEQFNCPICLDLPNDPVTIPCGHSYCMGCVQDHWSKEDPRGVFSCPQCRRTFSPKPSLSRNTMLAEAVAQLRRGALTPAMRESIRGARGPPAPTLSSAEVPCDVCPGEKRAAVKSCLACMSSYCEAHLKPHRAKAALRAHELIAPTGRLADKICAQHKYLQEFYCRQCLVFVCWLCTSNEHKGHDTASTKAERVERQKVLADAQTENSQKLKERQAEVKEMKKMMETMKRSADRVHGDTEQVLSELQRSVERLQELVEELMEQAGREKMAAAQEVVEQLEEEIAERMRRETEMKELVRCEDNIHYLQTCDTMCSPLASGDLPGVLANHEATFEPVRDVILDLQEKVEDLCNQELGKITKQVNDTTLFTLGNSGIPGGGPQSQPETQPHTQQQRLRVPLEPVQSQPGSSSRPSSSSNSSSSSSPGSCTSSTFNRMPSISSLFRSHRRATPQPATPDNNHNMAARNSWARGSSVEVREISIDSIQAPKPRSREEFLQSFSPPDACLLTLDPDTAHRRLSLSEGNTKATLQGAARPCPGSPRRFDGWTQALCLSPLDARRCYWEVEWRGRGSSLGVAYGSLGRQGSDARAGLGYNAQSWSLELSDARCLALHGDEKRDIAVTYSPRLGVFLDPGEGSLSFYSVAEGMGHLHTFRANFTQPLYAAFGVGSGVGVGLDFATGQFSSQADSVKICPM
ncbi:E3 ubiquitin/ISG15 ligase TRIM25 [Aplochiton taeniatus]